MLPRGEERSRARWVTYGVGKAYQRDRQDGGVGSHRRPETAAARPEECAHRPVRDVREGSDGADDPHGRGHHQARHPEPLPAAHRPDQRVDD